MATTGIEAVFLEPHNWGKTVKFFQALGYELEFETDHNSGQLRNGDGPYVSWQRFQKTGRPARSSSCTYLTQWLSMPIPSWRSSRRSSRLIGGRRR
jgi:hypothetical protein